VEDKPKDVLLGLSSLEPKRISAKESICSRVTRHFNNIFVLLPLGKWCRIDRFDVPEEYVQVLLADMPNAFLNSTRERRHLRPPVWKDTAKVMHYRTYEIEDIVAALGQRSGVILHLKKTYLGEKEVSECPKDDGRTALEVAKAKAHGQATNRSPTLQIQIVIGRGEGRATREFEIIWWPEMFSTGNHGKLTLRFYVSKVVF